MTNDAGRAHFWSEFIATRCHYPAPNRLRAQLVDADFSKFCQCGCNSFAVTVTPSAKATPLAHSGGGGAIFDAEFRLPNDQTLEIIPFADDTGNLEFVEVDCCANSYPVPDKIEVGEPFWTRASKHLLLQHRSPVR